MPDLWKLEYVLPSELHSISLPWPFVVWDIDIMGSNFDYI